jgi:hypothetical protein
MKKEKYLFGYTDPRALYGDPKVEWEPIKVSRIYEWCLIFCYFMLALSVSMIVAPMAWVQLFQWMMS